MRLPRRCPSTYAFSLTPARFATRRQRGRLLSSLKATASFHRRCAVTCRTAAPPPPPHRRTAAPPPQRRTARPHRRTTPAAPCAGSTLLPHLPRRITSSTAALPLPTTLPTHRRCTVDGPPITAPLPALPHCRPAHAAPHMPPRPAARTAAPCKPNCCPVLPPHTAAPHMPPRTAALHCCTL